MNILQSYRPGKYLPDHSRGKSHDIKHLQILFLVVLL